MVNYKVEYYCGPSLVLPERVKKLREEGGICSRKLLEIK